MKIPELLSPAGDFECLKAAIQNGADAVYLGASAFSARASAKNFNLEELEIAFQYAHSRNVEIHLTINTLIKNDEFDDAISLIYSCYKIGIRHFIIQDLGLSSLVKKLLPNANIHASTQMTVHNTEGVQLLEQLGFYRVVLSRELSINEIKEIRNNCPNIELEVFGHGALCISYSGQCLFSSMIGARSGNRGTCAQPCRKKYTLFNENEKIDSGYLLSPRDLCSLEMLPSLILSGIDSLKIEGRMKTPEYVATVTRIYRKYIDYLSSLSEEALEKLASTHSTEWIQKQDLTDLMQVFNRGSFSKGHLDNKENKKLIFKEKPNNMGIFLGKVKNFNSTKGYIDILLTSSIEIGDKISINDHLYNITELMKHKQNVKYGDINNLVTLGRIKGNIKIGTPVYKISSKTLSTFAKASYEKERKKIPLSLEVFVNKNMPIKLNVKSLEKKFYKDIAFSFTSEIVPEEATNSPITKEKLIQQFSKTGNTQFEFKSIEIDLDENLFIPNIARINELRRTILAKLEEITITVDNTVDFTTYNNQYNKLKGSIILESNLNTTNILNSNLKNKKEIAILLNNFNKELDYSKINYGTSLYIPFQYFLENDSKEKIKNLANKFLIYIYLPTISKDFYLEKIIKKHITNITKELKIAGVIVSNLGELEMAHKLNLPVVANYTLNTLNQFSTHVLKQFNIQKFTVSPELDKKSIEDLLPTILPELIVYGKTPVMNMNYCLLGNANKCYSDCYKLCKKNNKYFIKDELGFEFSIMPNSLSHTTTIYNSKTTSIEPFLPNATYRIDVLDESIEEINDIIFAIQNGNKLSGKNYTNGNLARFI